MKAEKKPIPEIAIALTESVAATDKFLNLLRNVGSYYYRRKIHLSDIELQKLLDENIVKQLQAARDYFLLYEFVEQRGLMEKFKEFHSAVMAETVHLVKQPEKDPEQGAQG